MTSIQTVIRRANAFGYDIHQSSRGWILSRDGKSFVFGKIEGVKSFLDNQVLR